MNIVDDSTFSTAGMPPASQAWQQWQAWQQATRTSTMRTLSIAAMVAAAALAVLACGFGVAVIETLAVFVAALAQAPGSVGAGVSEFLVIIAIITTGVIAAIIGGAIVLASRK